MDELNRLGICEVCQNNNAKYTCPKCEVKSCSVSCIKIHKSELNCDGIKDKTRFIYMKDYNSSHLESDYRFLENIQENVSSSKSKFHKIGKSRFFPKHLQKLQAAAQKNKIYLKFLPNNFRRHKENTTKLNMKTNIIEWRIQWVFLNTTFIKYHDENIPGTEKLASVLDTYLNGDASEDLKFYQAASLSGVQVLLKAEGKNGRFFYNLDPSLTINDCLAGKLIIEYPIIHIVLKDQAGLYNIIQSDEDKAIHKKRSGKNFLFVGNFSDESDEE